MRRHHHRCTQGAGLPVRERSAADAPCWRFGGILRAMGPAAFFDAIDAGDAAAVSAALGQEPALANALCDPGRAPGGSTAVTALHYAVHVGHEDVAALLVEAGADLDARNDEGRTALHDAIENGRVQTHELLLERGAEVDVCAAAILGHIDDLRAMLDRDVELANDRTTGLSPLGWAAYGNQADVAELLLDRGARMDDKELFCAAACGHAQVAEVLVRRGADPDEQDERGNTALHVAAAMPFTCDATDFVRLLLDARAETDLVDAQGQTALDIASAEARQVIDHPAATPGDCKDVESVASLLREQG